MLSENECFQCFFDVASHRLNVTEDGKKALITLANGDMRKVLNILQVMVVCNIVIVIFQSSR